jgi:hypothetical protein
MIFVCYSSVSTVGSQVIPVYILPFGLPLQRSLALGRVLVLAVHPSPRPQRLEKQRYPLADQVVAEFRSQRMEWKAMRMHELVEIPRVNFDDRSQLHNP